MNEELKGFVTVNVQYVFDLESDEFDDCETVIDALYHITEGDHDIADICNENKIASVYYEGFELKYPFEEKEG